MCHDLKKKCEQFGMVHDQRYDNFFFVEQTEKLIGCFFFSLSQASVNNNKPVR